MNSPKKGTRNNLSLNLQRLEANINKSLFFAWEILLAKLSPTPKMKILFSKGSDRIPNIKKGFHYLTHETSFEEFTAENVQKNDLVVPLNMEDLRYLAKVPQLVKHNLIPIPSLATIDICDDKYLFYKTLEEKGFGNVMPKIGNGLLYPYVLKKKVAQSGDDCFIIQNAEDQEKHEELANDPDYFCQQMIQGTKEYATHLFYKNGQVVCSINIKYIFADGAFVKGKDKFICTKISSCPHLDLFASVLDAIEYEGLCCFNYKEINGKPFIFEINPRFGGSLSTFFFSFLRHLDIKKNGQESPD